MAYRTPEQSEGTMPIRTVVRPATAYDSCSCGARKMVQSAACRSCYKKAQALKSTASRTCACGSPKDPMSISCRPCAQDRGAFFRNNPNHDAVREPTPEEVAWVAGIYEGEGSVRFRSGSFGISIPQQDPELLHRLPEIYGGQVRGPYGESGMHFWNVFGRRAQRVALDMWPWLTQRRQDQINEAHMNAFQERIA